MKKSTLLWLGVAAGAGYLVFKSRRSGMAGLGAMTDTEFNNAYTSATSQISRLTEQLDQLPAGQFRTDLSFALLKSMSGPVNLVQSAYNSWLNGNKEAASNGIQNVQLALNRLAPQIAAEASKTASSIAILAAENKQISDTEIANKDELALADKGPAAYVTTSIGKGAGEIVGGAASVGGSIAKSFLGAIPWWVYPVAIGGAGLYFFWPYLPKLGRAGAGYVAGKATAGLEGTPSPNPRRRRRSRR
jgi:hypothetical protein